MENVLLPIIIGFLNSKYLTDSIATETSNLNKRNSNTMKIAKAMEKMEKMMMMKKIFKIRRRKNKCPGKRKSESHSTDHRKDNEILIFVSFLF